MFLCLGIIIKKTGKEFRSGKILFAVAPHVHYLDSLVIKALGEKVATFLNYKNFYQTIDSIWKFKFHPENLKFTHDNDGFEAGLKHISAGNSFIVFPEGTVKKDEKVIFDFHNTLFKYFDEVQPVVLKYKYCINLKYGYQYPGFIFMDIISMMISPYTVCEVKVLESINIDKKLDFNKFSYNLREKMVSEIPGGYLENYLYTPESYSELLKKL